MLVSTLMLKTSAPQKSDEEYAVMALPHLGKLTKVTNLRRYWAHEAADFTPWLAQPENLTGLAEAFGIGELRPLQVEGNSGDFKVDIVAQFTDSDDIAIIENQLEQTDHEHLGKLLTYGSGRDAQVVIWIAKSFREEHRSALDWLNRQNQNAERPIRYFGVELELLRIDDSLPAPRFNIVVQPNEYAKGISAVDQQQFGEVSQTKLLQYSFWSDFKSYCEAKHPPFNLQKPEFQHWYDIAVGHSGFIVRLTANTRDAVIGCELYIHNHKAAFDALIEEKTVIEAALRSRLDWQRLDHALASRIRQTRRADLANKASWPELFAWMKGRVIAFRHVFRPRISSIVS